MRPLSQFRLCYGEQVSPTVGGRHGIATNRVRPPFRGPGKNLAGRFTESVYNRFKQVFCRQIAGAFHGPCRSRRSFPVSG